GPRAVGQLAAGLPVSRPAVSQHLKILKDAGLVEDTVAGTRRIYRLNLDKVLPDPARAQGLEKLASAIGAGPVLPGYQPPAPPAPRGRGGSRTSGAGQPAPPGGS
ncbi:MAG TPA: metalloregulator ArsR/SmtB family transcription factor, partial [Streptosporangiaceae bacterium]|nr:metalloregulator ArsR/SmtB family transcription factor [Streptosporangiaceae bacterium]